MNDELPIKSIFKAYDIRGVVGSELTTPIVKKIGQAIGTMALSQNQKTICVGYDGRLSSPTLSTTLIDGLLSTGINVFILVYAPHPMLYFSTFHQATGTGVMITGSHNPPEYNGFKMLLTRKHFISDDIQTLYQSNLRFKLS